MKIFVSWEQFNNMAQNLASKLSDRQVDLIVGVTRGGLPLAVCLSHLLKCRNFGTAAAKKTESDEKHEFDKGYELEFLGSYLPEIENVTNILVVDDIVGVGDLFALVDQHVQEKFGPQVKLHHVTLYADIENITKENPSLLDSLTYDVNVDNQENWIVFPWELQ